MLPLLLLFSYSISSRSLSFFFFFLLMLRPHPTSTLFPYTTLFRSISPGPYILISVRSTKPIFQFERHGLIDRKSTRLNSSHVATSYAVLCLKNKKQEKNHYSSTSDPTGDSVNSTCSSV